MKSRLNIYDNAKVINEVPSKVINSYFGLIICILLRTKIEYIDLLNTRNIIRYSKLIANDEA